MEWYWILLLVLGGILTGVGLMYLVFIYVFTDGFKNTGGF